MKQKINFVKRYLNYLYKGKSRYYIHSPFVYDFMMNVILDDRNFYAYTEIETLRTKLLKDNTTIEITDFGAGSRIMNSNERQIKQIAKYAATSPKKGELLFKIVNKYKIENILEFGTSLGIGTLYLSKANSNTKVTTLEGCKETAKIAKNNLFIQKANNVTLINDEFNNVLDDLLKQEPKPELIFFDGNHQKEATISYFNKCVESATSKSIFIFDDINWSDEMFESWQIVKQHPKVSLSINLFQLGILFFEERNQAEDFMLYF